MGVQSLSTLATLAIPVSTVGVQRDIVIITRPIGRICQMLLHMRTLIEKSQP